MPLNIITTAGIFFIVVLLLVLFLTPTAGKESRKERKVKEMEAARQKNWHEAAQRLEKQVSSLKQERDQLDKKDKEKEKNLMVERAKVKKLQEKVSQEREWHTKEESTLEQKTKEIVQFKEEVNKLHDNFSKEHLSLLRLQEEYKELKSQFQGIQEERRKRETVNLQLTAQVEKYRKDMVDLKKENIDLKKTKEDSQWVAKAEYERLERLLKEKDK